MRPLPPSPFFSFFHSLVLRLSAVAVHPTHQIIVMAPMRRERGGGDRPAQLVIPYLAPSSLLAFRSLF